MSASDRGTPTETSQIQPNDHWQWAVRGVFESIICAFASAGGFKYRFVRPPGRPDRLPPQPALATLTAAVPQPEPALEAMPLDASSQPESAAPDPDNPELGADGRARALTAIGVIRQDWAPYPRWPLSGLSSPDWAFALWPVFALYRTYKPFTDALRKLGFIHYAHWSIIKRIPTEAEPREALRYRYLLFEVSFDGHMDQYIDGLTRPPKERGLDVFRWIWGSSFGFPGSLPMPVFKAYIKRNAYRPSYFWSAYPEASTTVVESAVALGKELQKLKEAAANVSVTDEEFGALYKRSLCATQLYL